MAIGMNTLRLTGLVSGMDTDELVKSLMKIEQIKLDRQNSARTTLTWRQEAYSEVSNLLRDFKYNFASVMGADSLTSESAYNAYTVNVTGSGANAVTLTPSVYATAGSISIKSVDSLAKGASYTSTGKVSNPANPEGLSAATALKDLNLNTALAFDSSGNVSFSINGKDFTFNKDDTLGKMINTVNASDAGVTMTYSQITDKLSIETNAKGSTSSLSLSDTTGNTFAAFGISGATMAAGTNAKIKFSDGSVVERNSNTFTLDGITYALNRKTNPGEEIFATVRKDVSAVVDKVKKFVDGYNTLTKKLNELVSTRKSVNERGYQPLTDEEKASLTEEQIKSYEAIAKKGVIYGDAGIKRLLSNMRTAMYETVSSAGLSPASIGLKMGTYYEQDSTTQKWTLGDSRSGIALDENKLRAAIESNPERVMSVFSGEGGYINRVSSFIDTYNMGSGANNLKSLQDRLTAASENIAAFEEKMAKMEEKYYLKFAAMETAMSKMNEQSSWLASLLTPQNK